MAFDGAHHLPSPTGALLHVLSKVPPERPHAVVQINHGLAEHASRYGRFADALSAQGFAAYAYDHRGHGTTQAPDAPLGRFAAASGVECVIADVLVVHGFIAQRHPDTPVILFGHSMGGLVALNFLLAHSDRVHAAAIWNANVSAGPAAWAARAILGWERLRMGSDVPSRVLPRLTFQAWGAAVKDARTPFDWLSRDPAEVDKYIADPLCGWDASVSMWQDVFAMIGRGADDGNFGHVRRTLPLHLVGGAEDPATNGGQAVTALGRRLAAMGFSDVTSTVYPHTRHESLNELNRDAITADFIAWAARVSATKR